ncbi:MAG: DNA-binding NarL/FixJ family response regulator [Paraglaciecola sp.]|jgi:DNA-binding NarL/FixJ family response regulator
MPGSSDLFGLIHIGKIFPDLPLAVVSGLDDVDIICKVINVGAMGFVPQKCLIEHASKPHNEQMPPTLAHCYVFATSHSQKMLPGSTRII